MADTYFDIAKYIHFNSSGPTRSLPHFKLIHNHTIYTSSHHFIFNRLSCLWNALPPLNLKLFTETLKRQLYKIFWSIFTLKFDDNNYCTYHAVVPLLLVKLVCTPCLYYCFQQQNHNTMQYITIHPCTSFVVDIDT